MHTFFISDKETEFQFGWETYKKLHYICYTVTFIKLTKIFLHWN